MLCEENNLELQRSFCCVSFVSTWFTTKCCLSRGPPPVWIFFIITTLSICDVACYIHTWVTVQASTSMENAQICCLLHRVPPQGGWKWWLPSCDFSARAYRTETRCVLNMWSVKCVGGSFTPYQSSGMALGSAVSYWWHYFYNRYCCTEQLLKGSLKTSAALNTELFFCQTRLLSCNIQCSRNLFFINVMKWISVEK